MKGHRLILTVAAALMAALAVALLQGCTADTPGVELADEDQAALESLGYVANEIQHAGGTDPAKKVLVLGIDGMDWILASRLIDEGKLPRFQALAREGGFSPMLSSIPPQSPVAWSNFITGADPGSHGIFDFMHRDPETYLPYLSTSKAESAPDKAKVFGFIPVKNEFSMPFTDYVFPLAGGAALNLRRGVAFWQVLEAAGIPCTVFKIPSNFPPVPSEKGLVRSMSGMGTPDILGTYGTFSFYTTDPWPGSDDLSGGYVYEVDVVDNVVEATLYGPPNDFKDYEKIEERQGKPVAYDEKKVGIDFTVYVDPSNPVARLDIGTEEVLLKEGEFTDWVEVEFVMVPNLVTVKGLARFYLKQTHPEFELYCTPVQIHPVEQVLPITDPPEYGKELVDAVGFFYTQNMPEDTKALEHGVFDNDIFTRQSKIVFDERLELFRYELSRFDEGLLYFYFGSLDQSTHMMWRCMDPSHPNYKPEEDAAFADYLENLYIKFDSVLGEVVDSLDDNTTLIVLSDHGFAPYYRKFHLNRWLYDEGYLVLKPGVRPERVEWLLGIDWTQTRAYGIGINALYINTQGRESQGIVRPGREANELIDEIAAKLEQVRDPESDKRVVITAYKTSECYHGPYTKTAPDVILGYGRGYRGSDKTAGGGVGMEWITDNEDEWSGDHCMDYLHVPGVLFTNKSIASEQPALYDMAPTILAEFGIAKRNWMVGSSVFQTEENRLAGR